MRIVAVQRTLFKPSTRMDHAPAATEMLEGDVCLVEGDRPVLYSFRLDGTADLQKALARFILHELVWDDEKGGGSSQARLNGMRYASRVFGYTVPVPLRRRYGAAIAAIHVEHPPFGDMLFKMTTAMWDAFVAVDPEAAAESFALGHAKIHPDWFMGESAWTSGIINKSAALPYHRDQGNVGGTWSAMLALRRHVGGGGLHLPELGVTLAIEDGTVTLFDGHGTWHGVTPLNRPPGSYRYTLVWYTKAGFARCGPAADEPARAQQWATDRLKVK